MSLTVCLPTVLCVLLCSSLKTCKSSLMLILPKVECYVCGTVEVVLKEIINT